MPLQMVFCYTLLRVFAKALAIRKMRTVLQMVFMLRAPVPIQLHAQLLKVVKSKETFLISGKEVSTERRVGEIAVTPERPIPKRE